MSNPRRELDFLRDIEEAIERILEYTASLTWEDFLRDHKTQDAVVRNLEVIGEATRNLSDDFRLQHPGIPWRNMVGTRDRLTHHYFGVNQEVVWQIVEQDLPGLKDKIAKLVTEFLKGGP